MEEEVEGGCEERMGREEKEKAEEERGKTLTCSHSMR